MRDHKRVKGFTIVELVVVLAIIGALLGVLAPNMIQYYRNSRIKEANSDAKLVYNAAQTEVQKHIAVDRAAGTNGVFAGDLVIYYNSDGSVNYSGCADVAMEAKGDLATCTNADAAAAIQEFVDRVNTTVSGAGEVNWSVYINDYIVKACVSAEYANQRYIGQFSAEKSDGTQPENREMAAVSYETMMADGLQLKAIGTEFYDALPESDEGAEGEEDAE